MKNLKLQSAELVKPVSVNGCTVTMCLFDANEVVEAWAGSTEAAQRIVACVNACEGVNTEILERGVKNDWGLMMTELERERDELNQNITAVLADRNDVQTQRDELLAALELVVSEMDKSTRANVLLRIHENAKAAIAKAKGGAV